MMKYYCCCCPPLKTNSYLLVCGHTKEAVVIDPGFGSLSFLEKLLKEENYHLKAILLTHSHWDHIVEVAAVKRAWSVPVYVHKDDQANLLKPGADSLPFSLSIEPCVADYLVEEGFVLSLGSEPIEAIATPGHSPGSVCYYLKEVKWLFSGDTLFKNGYGTLQLPTAEPKKMWLSLRKLMQLPSDVKIFPGHGPSTTIQTELAWLKDINEAIT